MKLYIVMLSVALLLTHGGTVTAQSFVEPVYTVRSVKDVFYGTAKRFDGGTDSLRMNIYLPIGSTDCDSVGRARKRENRSCILRQGSKLHLCGITRDVHWGCCHTA